MSNYRTLDLQLPPNCTANIQLFRREDRLACSEMIVATVDPFDATTYRFDLIGITHGDYLCQLSGISDPNGHPFPLRITSDGIFHADHWREMDVFFPLTKGEVKSPIVFISYSHSDSAVADSIVATLDELGIQTFRDIKNIDWGEKLSVSVRNGLQSSAAILVILSPGSIKSQWVAYEVGFGIGTKKRILPYLTHRDLARPGFIEDLRYVKSVEEVREFFSKNTSWHRAT